MKVCIYFENLKDLKKSGMGRAYRHQINACEVNNIEYTTNYKDDYDILHINTYFAKATSVINTARKNGAKIIYHAHSTKEDFENSFIFSNQIAPLFYQRIVKLYSSADLIITPTPYSKSLLEGYGITVPIIDLSNGINITDFSYNEDNVKAYKEFFNIKESDKVIMSVGLLFKRKGLIDFVNLARKLPQYKFIWFGDLAVITMTPDIKKAIKEAPENCIFPGYIDGKIIKGAFSAADIFMFMSYEETEGIVVLEALASKTPTIIRDIPVYDEWLVDKKHVLKSNSEEDFINNIEYILNNDVSDMTNESFEMIKETKSIDIVSDKILEIYKNVLDDKAS